MSDKKYITKDSGHRRVFSSGAQRDRAKGKGRYDLIGPFAIKRLTGIYERGAEKYSPRNYLRGVILINIGLILTDISNTPYFGVYTY